jgi:OmpA-OmpF porin, OOP family
MTKPHLRSRLCAALLAGAGIAVATPSVLAQGTGTTPPASGSRTSASAGEGYSILPMTRRGYVGINLGQSKYKQPCGSALFGCDDSELSGKIYTGGMFNEWLGAEVGYLNMGKVDRAGGSTEAHGLNLSLVGRVALGQFNAFAKAGGTYGQTKVSSNATSGVASGKERGWGGSVGAGVGYDLTPTSGIVLEWERHEFEFAGGVKDPIEQTTIGYVHRF